MGANSAPRAAGTIGRGLGELPVQSKKSRNIKSASKEHQFTPAAPTPRRKLPNPFTTLFHLRHNPINLLTFDHYRMPFIRNRMFGLSAVFLNDPQLVRHVFVDNKSKYGIDPIRKLLLSNNFGGSIASVDGDDWHRARMTAKPFFASRHLENYASTFVNVAVEHAGRVNPSKTVSLMAFISEISFECAMRCLFSADRDESFSSTIEMTSVCMEYGMSLDLMDIWQMPPGIPRILKRSLKRLEHKFRRRVEELFDQNRLAGGSEMSTADSLLDAYRRQYVQDDVKGDARGVALDNVATMLGAAFESTTLAISWAIHFLSQSPGALDQVRREIDTGAHLSVSPQHWPDCLPLTLATLRETLRLYPTLPAISRFALEPDNIGGHAIQKGEFIVANIWAMHRDPRFWRQADQFRPERFLAHGEGASNANRYIPFGIGPRSCIGRHFAELEAVIILACLLHRFEFQPLGSTPPKPVWRGTLRPDIKMTMKMTARG